MRENKENWQDHLQNTIIEIAGLNEIYSNSPFLLQILSKLEGLQVVDTDFALYRKNIFDSISLLQELKRT